MVHAFKCSAQRDQKRMLYPLELEFIGSCELPDMGTDLRSFARALNDWPSPQPIREVFVFVFVFCFLFCFVLFCFF